MSIIQAPTQLRAQGVAAYPFSFILNASLVDENNNPIPWSDVTEGGQAWRYGSIARWCDCGSGDWWRFLDLSDGYTVEWTGEAVAA